MTEGRQWLPSPGHGGAALVTGSQQIRDETARVAAAAGLELTVTGTIPEARQLRPAVLLVGADCAASRPAPSGELIVVGLSGEDDAVWDAAARLHASRVAILPTAAVWLAERFAALRTSAGPLGLLLGVVSGAGGAGASSISCWLALAAARSGRPTLLVDGDDAGGGLGLALGGEPSPGVRWEDLGEISGTLNPDQLAGALPTVRGFSVLAMAGTGTTESTIVGSPVAQSVLDAARTAFSLTVVDLPTGNPVGGQLLQFCDEVVLVVPGRSRPLVAARSLAQQTQHLPTSVVARGPLVAGLDPHRVAELVGLPLSGYLPQLRSVPTAERQGRLLDLEAHRAVRRLTAGVLGALTHSARMATHER